MSSAPEQLQHHHIEDVAINSRESRIFRLCAGALCVACLTFGLLNLWGIIHV